ncbi:unnamed protein product [Phytomonas sp. EM1]|nr:unnamed protein product [Phytomonas sp. EM1]|eukprot:CCW59887.1 unnamed protein product [Phytomonas sp. isolate EM1]
MFLSLAPTTFELLPHLSITSLVSLSLSFYSHRFGFPADKPRIKLQRKEKEDPRKTSSNWSFLHFAVLNSSYEGSSSIHNKPYSK